MNVRWNACRCAPRATAILLALVAIPCGAAQAASPSFGGTSPIGVQRGTEVEVQFNGARLADAQEILFYEPGITVTSLEPDPKGGAVKTKLSIAPDCRLGMHKLRIRTATGISNLRTFAVGALPETKEVEPNNDFAQPQKIELDTVVVGVADNEDVDYYTIEAKKGERITAEIEGEDTRVITVRLPRSMHEALRAEAYTEHTSMNKLCISKLLQKIGSNLVPTDGANGK